MGSTSIAAMDSNTFSLSNPASYAQVKRFMFATGFTGSLYELNTGRQKYNSYDFQLPYLSFCLPLLSGDTAKYWRHWGLNVSLLPFSRTSYQSRFSNIQNGIPTTELYAGTGGFTKFQAGTGIQVSRNFYIGANAGYLFGNQRSSHASETPDSFKAHNVLRSSRIIAGGFVFDAGAIYKTKVGKTGTLQLGLNANIPSAVAARREEYAFTYNGNHFSDTSFRKSLIDYTNSDYSNTIGASDSIFNRTNARGNLNMPLGTGFGIQYTWNNALKDNAKKDNSFTIAADVYQRKWSEYTIFGSTEPLMDLTSFSGGFSIKPNTKQEGLTRMGNFLRRNEYRAGAKYSTGIYNLSNTVPVDTRLSFGIGMPMTVKQFNVTSVSFLDLTIEAGEMKGSTLANNLNQRYLIISLGFHLAEKGWFKNDRID